MHYRIKLNFIYISLKLFCLILGRFIIVFYKYTDKFGKFEILKFDLTLITAAAPNPTSSKELGDLGRHTQIYIFFLVVKAQRSGHPLDLCGSYFFPSIFPLMKKGFLFFFVVQGFQTIQNIYFIFFSEI